MVSKFQSSGFERHGTSLHRPAGLVGEGVFLVKVG